MKKIIRALLCLMLVLTNINPITIQAATSNQTPTYKKIDLDLLEYKIKDGKVTIDHCDKSVSGYIIIPEEIKGYPVKTINADAFLNCKKLEGIKLPNTLKTIYDFAFENCTNLKEIIIPSSVTKIGYFAFSKCENLESVSLSEGLKTIESNAFYKCTSLKEISIPKGVTTLDSSVFEECTNLKKVVIKQGIKSIENRLFYNCENLESVTLPSDVTSIGNESFYNCKNLKTINFPNTLKSIGESAFENCMSLEKVVLKNVKTIEASAFNHCQSIKEITLPETLTTIGDYAFGYMFSLYSLYIPSSVTKIGTEIFSFPEAVIACKKGSYAEKYAKENDLVYYYVDATEKANTLSGKVEENFSWKLNKVTGKLTVTCDGAMPAFKNGLPWKDYYSAIKNVEIKGNCTTISDNFAWTARKLESIIIPDTVTKIGEGAFLGCINLKNIDLPSKLKTIGIEAFYDCSSLEEIVIPDSVTKIDRSAFYSCSSLSNVILPTKLKTIESNTFNGCKSLTTIDIPNSVTEIQGGAFSYTGLKEIEIPYSVDYLGRNSLPSLNLKKISIYNPKCEIEYSSLNENGVVVYGYAGSTAVEFAEKYGAKFKQFDIYNASKMDFEVNLSFNKATYTGKTIKPTVTVKNEKDKVLVKDKDYTVSYSNNKNVGTGTVKITFKGKYKGTITKTFTINPKDASKFTAKLTFTKSTYNGNNKSPNVTVVDANGNKLVKGTDYTIKYGTKDRRNVGRYSVTITYIGNYKGTKKLWFTITPQAPENAKAELYGKDDVKFSWSKVSGATGYNVYYKKASASTYKLAGSTTKLFYKIPNLEDGIKYTFKVVPYYKTANGTTKYTSLVSKTASVTTKK